MVDAGRRAEKDGQAVIEVDTEKLKRFLERVPPLPSAAHDISILVDGPSPDLDKLAEILGKDPVLTARVLRVANSPFFGLSRRVATAREACIVLGLHTLRNLVLSAAAMEAFDHDGRLNDIWAHSARTAAIARHLAVRLDSSSSDAAFTTGLLHDIGALAMYGLLPAEEVAAIRERQQAASCSVSEAERAVLGFDHAAAGAAIVQQWHLPSDIVAAIAGHHAPDESEGCVLCDLIHVADRIARGVERSLSPERLWQTLAPGAVSRLGLSQSVLESWVEGLPALDEEAALTSSSSPA